MSEELNGAAVAPTPATEPTTPVAENTNPLANAEPAAPVQTPEAAPAVVEQAAIDAASAAAPAETPAPETPIQEQTEAAAAEQPQTAEQVVEITEELINSAIEVIKQTHRSSTAMLQRKLQVSYNAVVKVLDELTTRGVLAAQEGNAPRKILIELPPKVEVSKPVAPAPQPKKQFKGKPKMTDYDRMQNWKVHLKEIGHYTDDGFINAMAEYAQRNPGFNPHSKSGSCLIVMMNRLSGRCLNSLRTFTQNDADHLVKELLRFFAEQPLGDCAVVWNEKFTTNLDQKKAISQFFGIDKSYRDLRGNPNIVLTAVRDAAWPNKDEEARGTGGTFAERFHYLALCIVKFGSSDYAKALFENSFHTEPTDDFLNRVGGVRKPVAPSWIKDGLCSECGSPITKDSRGNDICSNPICEHHFAAVASDAPRSFRMGNKPRRDRDELPNIDPAQAPLPAPDGERRRNNWKDKKDRRHDHDDGERAFQKGNKKHGKRYRVNEEDIDAPTSGGGEEGVTVAQVGGGDGFRNNAFAGLELPAAAPEVKLPEPPPEQPVV